MGKFDMKKRMYVCVIKHFMKTLETCMFCVCEEENLQCKNVNKKGRANQENLYVK